MDFLNDTQTAPAILGAWFAVSPASAHPAWQDALPGTHAWLGDNGGSSTEATVCDTAAELDRYVAGPDTPPGCHDFPAGTPIILGQLTEDPHPSMVSPTTLIVSKITIPSRGYEGWTFLFPDTRPIIPVGAVMICTTDTNTERRLYSRENQDFFSGPFVGLGANAKVIRSDPNTGMIYVLMLDGKLKGKRGWLVASDDAANDISGPNEAGSAPIGEFYGSIIVKDPG